MLSSARSPGILVVTVRLTDDEVGSLDISFSSYPDIWGKKEVGPNVTSIDEACLQLRSWLEGYFDQEQNKRGRSDEALT